MQAPTFDSTYKYVQYVRVLYKQLNLQSFFYANDKALFASQLQKSVLLNEYSTEFYMKTLSDNPICCTGPDF